MKVDKLHKNLKKYLDKEWSNLEFEYSFENDGVTATADLTLTKCDVELPALVELSYCDNGLVMYDVTFDKLDVTFDNLVLVNQLNSDCSFFKAYITDKGYLRLSRYVDIYDESEVAECTETFFAFLLADSMDEDMKNVIPLLHE